MAVAVATLGVLAVLSAAAPRQAPREAWGTRSSWRCSPWYCRCGCGPRRGSLGALRAVGLIASALFLVNVVEASVPGFVPIWMRIEMVGIAVLMAAVIGLVIRERV